MEWQAHLAGIYVWLAWFSQMTDVSHFWLSIHLFADRVPFTLAGLLTDRTLTVAIGHDELSAARKDTVSRHCGVNLVCKYCFGLNAGFDSWPPMKDGFIPNMIRRGFFWVTMTPIRFISVHRLKRHENAQRHRQLCQW
jgi:hypothetical protein